MYCPTCKREYAPTRRVCPVDGTRLSPGRSEEHATISVPPTMQGHRSSDGSSPGEDPLAVAADASAPTITPHDPGVVSAPAAPLATASSSSGPLVRPGTGEADAELVPDQMIDEYQITGKLGKGGMGTVYAGVQPVIGKRVAVKVLLRQFASDPRVVNRFVQEARAVNQAQSRFIVDIFSFGALPDGRHYFVMEHIDGRSLREYLKDRGVLEFDEAYAILSAVARGLGAAHAKGIVHRDLKPENIIVVEEDGRPSAKILDFGIAKLVGGDDSSSEPGFATQTGTAMGTPYYMSPEQVRGSGVDHRTDVYALGIIVYEMFTGALPFDAQSYIELVNKHLFAAPPKPSEISASVPGELEALILRCIAKDPDARPQDMEEFLHELDGISPQLRGTRFSLTGPGSRPRIAPPMSPMGAPPGATPMQRRSPAPQPEQAAAPASRGVGRRRVLLVYLMLLLGLGGAGAWYALRHTSGSRVRSGSAVGTARRVLLRVATTPPGARVFVDGIEQPALTPLSLRASPGRHRVLVHKDGFRRVKQAVVLAAGRDRELSITLAARSVEPATPEVTGDAGSARSPPRVADGPAGASTPAATGVLLVRSGLSSASYRLGESIVGRGKTLRMDAVPVGTYTLVVSAPRWRSVRRSVRIEAARTSRVVVRLRRRRRAGAARTPRVGSGGGTAKTNDPDQTLNPFRKRK